jgi:small subunit ribosomal protein S17
MTTPTKQRRLTGTVVSDKMNKTVVVRVDRVKTHPKYHKQYLISARYLADDPQNAYHPNDRVIIAATRPLSAKKRWKVVRKI